LLQNVQKHLFHLPHDFLSEALDEDPYHSALITTELRELEQALANGVKFQFRGDAIDKPNVAWLWAHEYQPCDQYVQSRWEYAMGEGLRRFGYLFWDSKRMHESGILQKELVPPPPPPKTY